MKFSAELEKTQIFSVFHKLEFWEIFYYCCFLNYCIFNFFLNFRMLEENLVSVCGCFAIPTFRVIPVKAVHYMPYNYLHIIA